MKRAFILSPRDSDRALIVASSSIGGAPVTNLLKARPGLFWRSAVTNPYVEYQTSTAKTIDTIVFGFINAEALDTVRLRFANSLAATVSAPIFDTNTLFPGGMLVWPTGSDLSDYYYPHRVVAIDPITVSCMRIDYNFSSNSTGYVQQARLMVGKRIEPIRSVKEGWANEGNEEIVETVHMTGEESPRTIGTKRSKSVIWHDLIESEKVAIERMLLERGSSKDITLGVAPWDEGAYVMENVVIGRVRNRFVLEHTMDALNTTGGVDQHFSVGISVSEMAAIEMR